MRPRTRWWARLALLTALSCAAAVTGCGSQHHTATPAGAPGGQPASLASHQAGPRCPLTGVPARPGQDIHRVALAVKIDNIDAARPQAGIGTADVVVEELVEGGLTRLMAIFQCDSAATVGPIRSARISDADLLALLHGSVLGYSGANPADLPPIQAHGDAALISNDATPQYFHRDYSRAAPHNVFSATSTLLKAGVSLRHSLHAPKPLFSFGPLSTYAGRAKQVSVSWPAASASWRWSKHGWLRTQNGTTDTLIGGKQVTARDVVVMGVAIEASGLRDVAGNPSPIDVTVGSNPVWVFRNGHEVSGTWSRKSVTAPLVLRDHHHKQIRLDPGQIWMELLPRPSSPTVVR